VLAVGRVRASHLASSCLLLILEYRKTAGQQIIQL